MKKIALLLFLLCCTLFGFASPSADFKTAMRARKYATARKVLVAHPHTFSKQKLHTLSRELHSSSLQAALKATKNGAPLVERFGISAMRYLQIALFIEGEMKERLKKGGESYFSKKATGLACTIEYDKASDLTLLHFDPVGNALLGEGYFKSVSQSMIYDRRKPELVACGKGGYNTKREMKATRKLQGAPGIVEMKAALIHNKQKHKENTVSLILKNYNAGTVRAHTLEKKYSFTPEERMKLCHDVMQGLAHIHAKGYVHKDMHSGNVLLHVVKKGAQRNVEAVICDFGRTKKVNEAIGETPQAVFRCCSPESLEYMSLPAEGYKACEIYATGMILYKIWYERSPEWYSGVYFSKRLVNLSPIMRRYAAIDIKRNIIAATASKRENLLQKMANNTASKAERFEAIILQMVHPDPAVRSTAGDIEAKMRAVRTNTP